MALGSPLRELDPWQFRLSPGAAAAPRHLGAYGLEVGPRLPALALRDADRTPCGWVLGFAIDLRADQLPEAEIIAPEPLDPADPDGFVIALRAVLGGRYVILLEAGGAVFAYSDIAGQVSCVYDHESGQLGSSAHALLDAAGYESRFDHALHEALGVTGEGWLPAGLTAHAGVERLLPNHRIDLARGIFRRFWPREEIAETDDPEAVTAAFTELVQRQIGILARGPRRVALALTAGRETRMMLATARGALDKVDPLTIVGSDRHATDTLVARRIAKRFGLNHRELPRQTASAAQQQLFLQRIGHCAGDSNVQFHPSVWPIAETHVFVGGLGGEVGRGFFWRPADDAATPLAAQMLIRRFGLRDSGEAAARLAARLEDWLAALSWSNSLHRLDLIYLEHRLGPWGGAQFCGDPTLVRHAPMLTQAGVRMMISLPPAWKRGNRLGSRVVAREWPELEEIPYNSLGRGRDLWVKLRRACDNPRLVIKKLRKMRG